MLYYQGGEGFEPLKGSLSGERIQRSSLQLHFNRKSLLAEAVSPEVHYKTYRSPSDFYIYDRKPPAGFADWLAFATEKGCALEQYDRCSLCANMMGENVQICSENFVVVLGAVSHGRLEYLVSAALKSCKWYDHCLTDWLTGLRRT